MELDLYSHIPPQGIDAPGLAKEIGGKTHPLGLLLEALRAIGILLQREGMYLLPPDFADLLVRGPGSFADFLLFQQGHYRSWSNLVQLVQGTSSEAAQEWGLLGSPELIGHYLDLIGANNRLTHKAVANHLAQALHKAGRALDLGGGDGQFAKLLTDQYPSLRVRTT